MLRVDARLYRIYHRCPPFARDLIATTYAAWSSRVKYGPHFETWRATLAESQWWDERRLRSFQEEQLATLFRFVARASPYYAALLQNHGIRGSDPLAEVQRLPIIDKTQVRENYASIATSLATSKTRVLATAGTTGLSLRVPMTAECMQREYAFRWQYQGVAGASRGSSFAYFTGHQLLPTHITKPPFHVRNLVERSIMFSLFHMSSATLPRYAEELTAFAPSFIAGYPSALYVLATFALQHGLRLPTPRAIFTASETLHPAQREAIESAFGARIFEWYGQTEITVNLHECTERKLHVKEEYGLLELLRPDGTPAQPGESGAVIGTGWGNSAFPMIRYRTGDNMILAADQTCRCGRGGRIIERILGRDDDIVVTPDGRFVGRLDFVFKPVTTVRESQIVQVERGKLVIRIVPTDDHTASADVEIVRLLRERVGDEIAIEIEKVAQIPRDASGKLRYVVSKLPAEQRYGVTAGAT